MNHWPYALCAAVITAIGIQVMYGAALASARAYGHILITIHDYVVANVDILRVPRGPSN